AELAVLESHAWHVPPQERPGWRGLLATGDVQRVVRGGEPECVALGVIAVVDVRAAIDEEWSTGERDVDCKRIALRVGSERTQSERTSIKRCREHPVPEH